MKNKADTKAQLRQAVVKLSRRPRRTFLDMLAGGN